MEEIIGKILSNAVMDKKNSHFDYLDRANSSELCNWTNEVKFNFFTKNDVFVLTNIII